MSETGNNIDAPTLRRRRLVAAAVLGGVLFIGAIPILLPVGSCVINNAQIHAKRSWLLTDVDHLAVRDAGRLLLAVHEKNSVVEPSQLPKELARLGPNMMAFVDDRGLLRLEFGGGFFHYGLFVVPEDADGITLDIEPPLKFTLLVDGVCFYEEIW